MSQYRTVVRVQDYKENLCLVWVNMIGWQMDPFWYPADQFIDLIGEEELRTASVFAPMRFICDADIYAEDIAGLNIQNIDIASPPPKEWL